jgi:DMSO reductase anchor subunit
MRDWSLVAFTLLIQSAVGLIWTLLPLNWIDLPVEVDMVRWSCRLALGLCVIGLAAGLRHLGSPAKALHAMRNLSCSWLSREIAAVGVFTGMLLLLLLTLRYHTNQWATTGVALCSIAGALELYTMIRVYRLKTVPVWNNGSTPWDVVGSALTLGGVLGFGIQNNFAPGAIIVWAAFLFIFGGVACKMVAGFRAVGAMRLAKGLSWYALAPKAMAEPIATGLGIGLLLCATGSVYMGMSRTDRFIWFVLALVFFSVAEVWGRWRFYNRYFRIGL